MRFTVDDCLSFFYLTAHMPTCTAAYSPGMNGVSINQTLYRSPGPAVAIHALTRTTRDIIKGQFPEDLSGHDSETTSGSETIRVLSLLFKSSQQRQSAQQAGLGPRQGGGRPRRESSTRLTSYEVKNRQR